MELGEAIEDLKAADVLNLGVRLTNRRLAEPAGPSGVLELSPTTPQSDDTGEGHRRARNSTWELATVVEATCGSASKASHTPLA